MPEPVSAFPQLIPPSTRAPRIAVSALFLINGFAFATWVSRIPEVQASLALTPGTLGAALMGLGAGSFVAMPIAGWLIARAGSRRVVLVTTLACAALLVLPAFAWNAVALAAALAIFGAAMGAMDVGMNAQGVELEHRVGRPILSGFHALFSLGGMSGAGIGGVIAAAGVSVTVHFALIAALLAVVAVAILPSLLEAPPPPADAPAGRLRVSPALVGLSILSPPASSSAKARWPTGRRSIWPRCSAAGPGVAAAGYAAFSAAMTIGRLSGDWLTVRVGRVRIVRAGALLAAAGLSAALLIGTVPAALIGFVCVGAGFSVAVPLVFSAAGRLDSRSAGPGPRRRHDGRLSRLVRRATRHRLRGAGVHAAARPCPDCGASPWSAPRWPGSYPWQTDAMRYQIVAAILALAIVAAGRARDAHRRSRLTHAKASWCRSGCQGPRIRRSPRRPASRAMSRSPSKSTTQAAWCLPRRGAATPCCRDAALEAARETHFVGRPPGASLVSYSLGYTFALGRRRSSAGRAVRGYPHERAHHHGHRRGCRELLPSASGRARTEVTSTCGAAVAIGTGGAARPTKPRAI